jgi:hypothetical protein
MMSRFGLNPCDMSLTAAMVVATSPFFMSLLPRP